ncbi:hypothetical protein DFJ58DRAFT_178312 [Suillus subalutaceus]|uniref:uncharacterized protein n=1 Tax=Suillus subalutaceus TaxID=48586 RepID=UPI001B86EE87|nr:uncharacterized protein DFJ58DRAFT_178312 [Suillus subalutaceus]KAG1876495.1 hypothetical protein DFJ58DRAFT_178312 [Suillus subalutaceus]
MKTSPARKQAIVEGIRKRFRAALSNLLMQKVYRYKLVRFLAYLGREPDKGRELSTHLDAPCILNPISPIALTRTFAHVDPRTFTHVDLRTFAHVDACTIAHVGAAIGVSTQKLFASIKQTFPFVLATDTKTAARQHTQNLVQVVAVATHLSHVISIPFRLRPPMVESGLLSGRLQAELGLASFPSPC